MAFTPIHKFGRNADIDSAAAETIWDAGGTYVWPTTSEPLSVVSDSTDDDAAGTGLRTLEIQGLDLNWNEISETVTLDGTTPVVTDIGFFRVFRIKGMTAGSGSVNAGNVTVTNETSGQTLGKVEAGKGQSQLALYSVPAGQTLSINEIICTPFKAAAASYEVRMMTRKVDQCWNLKATLGGHTQAGGTYKRFDPAYDIPEKTDIEFVGEVTANNVGLSVEFTAVLV